MTAGTSEANREALDRIRAATPFLIDLRPAREVVSGLGEREFLHAGPPLEGWGEGLRRAARRDRRERSCARAWRATSRRRKGSLRATRCA
jgi:hypothetical protein